MSDIKKQDPALYKKICDAVYRNYQFRNGDYYDKTNDKRSASKFDFKVDYINPNGKTTPDNLHLVYQLPPITPPVQPNANPIAGTNLMWAYRHTHHKRHRRYDS